MKTIITILTILCLSPWAHAQERDVVCWNTEGERICGTRAQGNLSKDRDLTILRTKEYFLMLDSGQRAIFTPSEFRRLLSFLVLQHDIKQPGTPKRGMTVTDTCDNVVCGRFAKQQIGEGVHAVFGRSVDTRLLTISDDALEEEYSLMYTEEETLNMLVLLFMNHTMDPPIPGERT